MNKTNRIPSRIAEALQKFPPFSMLPSPTVSSLAEKAQVKVLVEGDKVWNQGDPPGDEVLFLAMGRVEYRRSADGIDELVDVRDVGDILGLSALHEGESYRVTAEVKEDSILYVLPWADMQFVLEVNDQARNYVRRHLFWGTRVGRAAPTDSFDSAGARGILDAHLDGAQIIQTRPPEQLLNCQPDTPIRAAAEMMVQRNLSSILVVDKSGLPLGFVTHEDLVREVVVGSTRPTSPVARIMRSPATTVSAKSSTMAALLTMLHERIDHICITEDGTAESRALDVCTPKDLLSQSGHHPVGIADNIQHARSAARLRELCDDIEEVACSYLEAGISGILMGQICAQLYDTLVTRMIEMAEESMAENGQLLPDIPWAWMAVGSDGRREQVLRTDMDNALVFESSGDPEQDELNRGVFLRMAELVINLLIDAGFARCQGGVMASNPRWCRTDTEWIEEISSVDKLSQGDNLLRALVLYDLRHVAGDRDICVRIRDTVFEISASAERMGALRQLAEMVVANPPPLNFRGKFIVEKKGLNEGEFDIKKRGLSPLRDAARVFALHYGLKSHHSTGGRWAELAILHPELAEVANLARSGYDQLLRFRTLTGLKRKDDGRFIDPGTLNRLEREQLANVFDVQRMVQNTVRRHFNLELQR
ncbi:MAG: CBS domain-containing protein [Pontiellaceae bacterium]|nr:CBS domain-containing protein [Pontiellaceae bacterium]MBN2784397.1 CBS domain-containing protein [Pontiellaceae bacterium]